MCHLFFWHTKRAQTPKGAILRGWKGSDPPTNVQLTQFTMTVSFSKDVMIGMLRKGETGNQILDILDVIAPDQTEVEDNSVTDVPTV